MGLPVNGILDAGAVEKLLVGYAPPLLTMAGPGRFSWARHQMARQQRVRLTRMTCCYPSLVWERRQRNLLVVARGDLQGLEEFRADVGPANEQATTDRVERCAAVVAFDDRFCGIQREGDETTEDQESLRRSDLLPAGAGKGKLTGRNE